MNKWVATPTRDKPNKKNGRYFYNGEACFFKNWATGEQSHWSDKYNQIKSYSTEQRKAYFAELKAKRHEVEAEDRKFKLQEVNKAFSVLKVSAVTHPYLEHKQALIRPDFIIDVRHSCLQKMLVIPIYNIAGVLVAYQRIDADGNKKFKTGSQLSGAFYPIKPYTLHIVDLDIIFLCEGYATGSSIYQALNDEYDAVNFGVLCCFSASNIDAVYDVLRSKFANKNIIHIKDQDDAGNKSKVAGFTVGFAPGQDANDIACQFGLDTLARIIKSRLFDLTFAHRNYT